MELAGIMLTEYEACSTDRPTEITLMLLALARVWQIVLQNWIYRCFDCCF